MTGVEVPFTDSITTMQECGLTHKKYYIAKTLTDRLPDCRIHHPPSQFCIYKEDYTKITVGICVHVFACIHSCVCHKKSMT